MLEYLTLILVCQLIGELFVGALQLPFPGPVVGMVLLLIFLIVKAEVPEALAQVSGALLNNLSLMFVPAGVGVIVHFALLGAQWLPITLSLLVSTSLTIALTALVMVLLRRSEVRESEER